MVSRLQFDELVPCFLKLKRNISGWCDGNVEVLYEDAKKDIQLRKWCVDLKRVANELMEAGRAAEFGVIAPVNPEFIRDWNEYVEAWACSVSLVADYDENPELTDMFKDALSGFELELNGEETEEDIRTREKFQADHSIKVLKKIREAFEDYGGDETFEGDALDDHINSLEVLRPIFSLDEAAVRASYISPVLVPPTVANKISPNTPLSLYRYWNEARSAFILGMPLASMAMARATLEILLCDVYMAEGRDLKEKIDSVRGKRRLSEPTLTKIRLIGNAIMHGMRDDPNKFGKDASENATREARVILDDLKRILEKG